MWLSLSGTLWSLIVWYSMWRSQESSLQKLLLAWAPVNVYCPSICPDLILYIQIFIIIKHLYCSSTEKPAGLPIVWGTVLTCACIQGMRHASLECPKSCPHNSGHSNGWLYFGFYGLSHLSHFIPINRLNPFGLFHVSAPFLHDPPTFFIQLIQSKAITSSSPWLRPYWTIGITSITLFFYLLSFY